MKRLNGQIISAALCWFAVGSVSAESIYEYRFNLDNKLYVVDSQEEVEQIIKGAGESYSVLKVAEEIELTETDTLQISRSTNRPSPRSRLPLLR